MNFLEMSYNDAKKTYYYGNFAVILETRSVVIK